ncbi:MAG: hypothetical protein MUP04_09095 [Anaerolineae bacterium]|nr:hypothetical protein [Anaerolineae bacterium]
MTKLLAHGEADPGYHVQHPSLPIGTIDIYKKAPCQKVGNCYTILHRREQRERRVTADHPSGEGPWFTTLADLCAHSVSPWESQTFGSIKLTERAIYDII